MSNKNPIRITLKALDGKILHLDVDNHPSWHSTFPPSQNMVKLCDDVFSGKYVYNVIYECFIYTLAMSDKDVTIAKMLGIDELPFNEHVTITRIWL